MLKQAEIPGQTGIMYLSNGPYSSIHLTPIGAIGVHQPTILWTGTGEDTRPKPGTQLKIPRDLLPYQLLSRTTGSELHDFQALLLLLVMIVASNHVLTDYHTSFQIKDSMQIKLPPRIVDQAPSLDTNSASLQAARLRTISGLKVEHLAEIFGVSRATYYKWLSGSPLHDTHRQHLLEVVTLVEEAAQRFGSTGATNTWLLTPVAPGGKKPIDYLAAQQYSTFRGFLLRVRTGHEVFRPLVPSKRVYQERSREEIEDAHERLRPRAWRDEAEAVDASDTNDKEA